MKKQNVVLCPEWADKLAMRQDDLSSVERAALQEHLATCPACASAFMDFQDLIVRIRALPRPEMEIPMQELSEGLLSREVQKSENSIESNEFDTSDGLSAVRKRKPRRNYRQYATLVAVLLVALLTTTFALLFIRIHTSNTGASQFRLTQGWSQLAFYSGTGSQTISVGNLRLPMFWGTAEACQGQGKLVFQMSGPSYIGDGDTDNCSLTNSPITAPATILFTQTPTTIQTIRVTAPTTMTWKILLVKETSSPAFSLSSAWADTSGIGGTTPVRGNVLSPTGSNGHTLPLSSRWAVLTLCVGEGHGLITLDPNPGSIPFSCDGQPVLHIVDYSTATQVQEISATTSGQVVWTAEVLMCTQKNKALCR